MEFIYTLHRLVVHVASICSGLTRFASMHDQRAAPADDPAVRHHDVAPSLDYAVHLTVFWQCAGLYGPDPGCWVVYSWPFPDLSGVGQWGTL